MTFALHHIGYLASDLEAAAARWCADLGYLRDGPVHEDAFQTAKVCFLRLPGHGPRLELISPAGKDSKLSNALRKGVTLHHLCYEVPKITDALATLRGKGWLQLGEPAPAVAFGGRSIAWMMDKHGVLIELLQSGPGPYQLKTT